MEKSGKTNKPAHGNEEAGYCDNIHDYLDEIHFPNDESGYSGNYSPGCYQVKSSSSTPIPHTPNEGSADGSNLPREGSTLEKNMSTKMLQEPASTLSHIDESDLSSISNIGVGASQLNLAPMASAENSTIQPRSSEVSKCSRGLHFEGSRSQHIRTFKKSEDQAAIFPTIEAPSVNITVQHQEESPLDQEEDNPPPSKKDNDESLSLTPSCGQDKAWTFTPQDTSTNRRDHSEDEDVSPEFYSNQEERKKNLIEGARETTKKNLDSEIEKQVTEAEYILSEDFHHLKYMLSEANIKIRQLVEENNECRADQEAKAAELIEMGEINADLKSKIEELNEHIQLMQQQCKDEGRLPLLRGQILENAKMEIAQLRQYIQERDKKLTELELYLSQKETHDNAEGKSMMKEIENLCLEVQKYKIKSNNITKNQMELEEAYKEMRDQNFELQKQIEENNKETSIAIKKLENEKFKLLQQIKKCEADTIKDKKTKESLQINTEELKLKYEQVFAELNEMKNQMSEIGGNFSQKEEKHSEYINQVAIIKGQFSKKVSALTEENEKLKERLAKCEKANPLPDEKEECFECSSLKTELEKAHSEITNLKKWLEVGEEEEWEPRLEEILAEIDTGNMIKNEFEQIQIHLKECQQNEEVLKNELNEARQHIRLLEANNNNDETESVALQMRIHELEVAKEKESKSKIAVQTQLNNTNSIVKEKEQEIQMLQQSRDIAENNEKQLREELEEMRIQLEESKCKEPIQSDLPIKMIDSILSSLSFSFIKMEFPIKYEMSSEEKLGKLDEFLKYIEKLQENIESNNESNISNIRFLKEQINLLEQENKNLNDNIIESQRKCIHSLEKDKSELLTKVTNLEKESDKIRKQNNEFESTLDLTKKSQFSEVESLKKQLVEMRNNLNEQITQKNKLHNDELEAANSAKQGAIKTLENRVALLEDKVKRKKEKAVVALDESAQLFQKHEQFLLEYKKLDQECKRLLSLNNDYGATIERLSSQVKSLETSLREEQQTNIEIRNERIEIEEELRTQSNLLKQTKKQLEELKNKKPIKTLSQHVQVNNGEFEELHKKLTSTEKTLKQYQQLNDESHKKIEELTDSLQQLQKKKKASEDQTHELEAENRRLEGLLEQAKTEMKKIMATSKKMNQVRGSHSDVLIETSAHPRPGSISLIIDKCEPINIEFKNLLSPAHSLAQEAEVVNLNVESLGVQNSTLIVKHPSNLLNPSIEQQYVKQIEELQGQLMKFTAPEVSKLLSLKKSHSLQESIDVLRESLNESERQIEEQKARQREEYRRAIPRGSRLPDSTRSRKQGLPPRMSPLKMSPMEQQYKRELDSINNEEGIICTNRTISFGAPEVAEFEERFDQTEDLMEETIKLRLDQDYTEKIKQLEATHKSEIEALNNEIEKLKEQIQKQSKERDNNVKREVENIKIQLEEEKQQELDDLLQLKEQQLRANLNIELMKAINEKREELTKQYMQNKELMQKEFESLKDKLTNDVEGKSERINQEYADLIREKEDQRMETERKYNQRIDEKEKLLEDIMKMRIKEMEEEYKLKAEKLEYSVKYEAQCETERQRADISSKHREIEEKYRKKAEDLECRLKDRSSEDQLHIEELERELQLQKLDAERRIEQIKRSMEKDSNSKLALLTKSKKDAQDQVQKLKKQIEELEHKANEDQSKVLEQYQKKAKEEQKLLKEKHTAELRRVKETHKNELIKKDIEKEREIKKMTEVYNLQLEQLSKTKEDSDTARMETKLDTRRENDKLLQQRMNALKKKLESEYLEKEKSLKQQIENKEKAHEQSIKLASNSEKVLREKLTMQFEAKLKEEVNRLKTKYQEKKHNLETLRNEYEENLRAAMKENRMRDSNNSFTKQRDEKRPDTTLSEIDADEIIKENEDRMKYQDKMEIGMHRIKEQYDCKVHKLETELDTMTSRAENRGFETLQTFVEILTIEMDKLMKHTNSPSVDNTIAIENMNQTIAKMIVQMANSEKARALLETFKVKLNSVIFAFKQMIESQYKTKNIKQEAERESEDKKPSPIDTSQYFEVMDSSYEGNVLTKITPIQNNKGKYVVDVEKVVRDLLLVREALYSVFQKSAGSSKRLEGTSCTILEELSKIQSTATTQTAIDNIAKHYRILLNTILRFAVEAAWVLNQEQKALTSTRARTSESEEILKLKLIITELREQMQCLEEDRLNQRKKLALFVGEDSFSHSYQ